MVGREMRGTMERLGEGRSGGGGGTGWERGEEDGLVRS